MDARHTNIKMYGENPHLSSEASSKFTGQTGQDVIQQKKEAAAKMKQLKQSNFALRSSGAGGYQTTTQDQFGQKDMNVKKATGNMQKTSFVMGSQETKWNAKPLSTSPKYTRVAGASQVKNNNLKQNFAFGA